MFRQDGKPSMSTHPTRPKRAALIRHPKVGDRVKRGPDWSLTCANEDKGGAGTITAIPSQVAMAHGWDPNGWVDVLWDAGGEFCYRMGCDGRFELDFVD